MDEQRAAVVPLTRAQRVLAGIGGLFFAGLAGLGGYGSFASVRDVAEPWFGGQAWIVPAGVDLGILALVSVALLLEWLAMPMPALRWMAFAFTTELTAPAPQPVDETPPAEKPAPRRTAAKAPSQKVPSGKALSEKAPRGVAADNEARALAILDAEPGITGAELARRLDISSRQGQRLLSRLNRPAPTHTS